MAKFCPACGKPISEIVKFCPECGVDVGSFSCNSEQNLSSQKEKESAKFKFNPDALSVTDIKSSMGLQMIKGVVSHVRTNQSTYGSVSTSSEGRVSGFITTDHWATFRINNQECFWGDIGDHISDGDTIAVAGYKSGNFYVLAFYNFSTNQYYWHNPRTAWFHNQSLVVNYFFMGLTALIGFGLALWLIGLGFMHFDGADIVGGIIFFAITAVFLNKVNDFCIQLKSKEDAIQMIQQIWKKTTVAKGNDDSAKQKEKKFQSGMQKNLPFIGLVLLLIIALAILVGSGAVSSFGLGQPHYNIDVYVVDGHVYSDSTNFHVVYGGGGDSAKLTSLKIVMNSQDPVLWSSPKVGDYRMFHKGTSGKDHMVVTGTFSDGSSESVFDQMI